MTINPRDYDLDELRKMARQHSPDNGLGEEDLDAGDIDAALEEGSEDLAGQSFRSGLYRELLPFLDGAVEKPYLRALPETYAAEYIVFEWLEFLVMHAGYQGATDALEYYESVEWITDDVRSDLGDYLLGVDDAGSAGGSSLEVDDHLLSLVYVAKLGSLA